MDLPNLPDLGSMKSIAGGDSHLRIDGSDLGEKISTSIGQPRTARPPSASRRSKSWLLDFHLVSTEGSALRSSGRNHRFRACCRTGSPHLQSYRGFNTESRGVRNLVSQLAGVGLGSEGRCT